MLTFTIDICVCMCAARQHTYLAHGTDTPGSILKAKKRNNVITVSVLSLRIVFPFLFCGLVLQSWGSSPALYHWATPPSPWFCFNSESEANFTKFFLSPFFSGPESGTSEVSVFLGCNQVFWCICIQFRRMTSKYPWCFRILSHCAFIRVCDICVFCPLFMIGFNRLICLIFLTSSTTEKSLGFTSTFIYQFGFFLNLC